MPTPDGQNTPPGKRKTPVGTKGYTGNPGGRPKGLREIEAMLNAEHRTAANMREVFRELKELALRGDKGDAQYMKLYLERVLGPVKDVEELERVLADAPPEVVAFIREHFN